MVNRLGDRLPQFTPKEIALVHGSSEVRPPALRSRAADASPQLTVRRRAPAQFYGMNTYTTNTVRAGGQDEPNGNALLGFDRPDGTTALGTQCASARRCAPACSAGSSTLTLTLPSIAPAEEPWLQDVPWGFRALLKYLADRYRKPIYVTENGFAVKGESKLSKEAALRQSAPVVLRAFAPARRLTPRPCSTLPQATRTASSSTRAT